ncbi:MAG: twin-arginine translocase TatA/TatE family subunit [Planctomycetes bacterium]|nr:twin-arginine translocase TatA/TatE family subunit [Planctomycetota bacterium]
MLGHWELLVVLVVALLIFGPRLPSVMRALGKSVNEFKKGVHEVDEEVSSMVDDDAKDENTGKHSGLAG